MCRSSGTRDVPSSMKKFPEDIAMAETLTGGDPNIIYDPCFLPEQSVSVEEQLGFKKTPKPKKSERFLEVNKSTHLKTLGFLGDASDSPYTNKNHESYIRIQRTPFQYNYLYKCGNCTYTCNNKFLVEVHTRVHSTHDTNGVPLRFTKNGDRIPWSSTPKYKQNKIFKRKYISSSVKRKNQSEDTGEKKRHKKNRVKTDSKQNNDEIRENLLKDWMDDSGEETGNVDESMLDDSLVQETDKTNGDLEETTAPNTDTSNIGDTSKCDEKSKVIEKSQEKSCFDFDDIDESINLNSSMKFGQKLPRVISAEKPKKQEIPIFDECADDKQDHDVLSKEFTELLDDTQVPQLPDIPSTLFSSSSKSPKKHFLDETLDETKKDTILSPKTNSKTSVNRKKVKSTTLTDENNEQHREQNSAGKDDTLDNDNSLDSTLPRSTFDFNLSDTALDKETANEKPQKSLNLDSPPLKKRKSSEQKLFLTETEKAKDNTMTKDWISSPFKKRKQVENEKSFDSSLVAETEQKLTKGKEEEEMKTFLIDEASLKDDKTVGCKFPDLQTDDFLDKSKDPIETSLSVNSNEITQPENDESEKNMTDSQKPNESTANDSPLNIEVNKEELINSEVDEANNISQHENKTDKAVSLVDPSEMELDINSMPIVLGDDLIPDLKSSNFLDPPTSNENAETSSVKKIKIQLKKASDTKLPGDLSYINGKQVITIPGKQKKLQTKDTLLNKRTVSSTVTSSVQSITVPSQIVVKSQKTAGSLIKIGDQDVNTSQKILLLPTDSTSNGQTVTLSAESEKILKTGGSLQLGTRVISTKGLLTQQGTAKTITLSGNKGSYIVKKANILSNRTVKTATSPPLSKSQNILASTASTSKQVPTLKNIIVAPTSKTVVTNPNVKLVTGQPKFVQIQRPTGGTTAQLKVASKGSQIVYIQSPHSLVSKGQTLVKQTLTTGPIKTKQLFKPRQASPNILQKSPRKTLQHQPQKVVKPVQQQQSEMLSIPVVQNLQSESNEQMKMVYLTVDGTYQPIDNSSLIPVEGGGNNIFLETNSGDVDKLFLSIDGNGQLINITNPSVSTTSQTPPGQDILAKALANTQVLQNETSDSLDCTNVFSPQYPPPLTLSHNVLETSFTINQPIMTPQEVPSSVTPKMAGLAASIVTGDKKVNLPPSMPLLSDDLEGQTVYITDNPSSSQQFTIQVLNENENVVSGTSTTGQLSHVIYTTSEQLPSIDTLQKKAEPHNFDSECKSNFRVLDSSDVEAKDDDNLPNVQEHQLVVEQVDSLNEPYLSAPDKKEV